MKKGNYLYKSLLICVFLMSNIVLISCSKEEDWYYTDYGDRILIDKYLGVETEVIVPSKINNKRVTAISLNAFDDKPTKIIIEEGIEYIYPYAFFEAKSVESISIPKTVIEIGYNAFNGASSLTEIIVDPDNQHYLTENGVLFSKDRSTLYKYPEAKIGKTYTIPEHVSTVYRGAFVQFKLHRGFLDGPKLENIYVDMNNKYFSSVDGVLFNKDKTVLIKYPEWKKETSYVIPDNVELIDRIAFANSQFLEEVIIPSSVKEIEYGAFFSMKNILRIYLERDNKMEITKLRDKTCFDESNEELVIYVPSDSFSDYINSNGWNNYVNKIKVK